MAPIGQAGRIRLSPLKDAVMSSKAGTTSSSPASKSGAVGGRTSAPVVNAPTEEQIAQAKELAAKGDQDAIDWLKALGIVGGVAGAGIAGTALYNALRNKKTKGAPAASVSSTTGNASTSSRSVTRSSPQVTPLKDEQIIPRDGPVDLIDAPYKRLGYADPTGAGVPVDQGALTSPGPNYPVGPTKRQMEEDAAYMMNDIMNNKPKVALKKAAAAAKAARMQRAAEAFRRIR